MPIHYVCVSCREEIYLTDDRAGKLSGCPRCRLKFLAPAPNIARIPPQAARPAAPPPAAPAPGAPVSSRPNLAAAVSASGIRRPGAPAATPPAPGVPGRAAPTPTPSPALQRPAAAVPGAAAPGRPATAPVPTRPAAPASPGAPVARPTAGPTPARPYPQPGAPAARQPSPPPSYPRDAVKPPLYPLDTKPIETGKQSESGSDVSTGSGLFGMKSSEMPALGALFDSDEEETSGGSHELFADAIPSAPAVDDGLDVPIDVKSPDKDDASDDELEVDTADEGGGVAIPQDDDVDEGALATDPLSTPEPSYDAPASAGELRLADEPPAGESLISMDDIFSGGGIGAAPAPAPAHAAPSAPPSGLPGIGGLPGFGAGGVLPAPFLKPVEPAPAPAPASTAGGRPRPFALIPIEGIPDARFDLPGGEVYLLGRDKDAHVKILSTSVSRRHARIDGTGSEHVLIDLGSANGTQVNGQSVARQALKDGDLIRMGKVILRYAAV